MNITELTDSSLNKTHNKYTIKKEKENHLLKSIRIPKEERIKYAFLGGMWYSKKHFSFEENDISLPYPFTSYYTLKILDKTIDDTLCRSAIYVKMPIAVLQFPKTCYIIEFDPYIHINNKEIFIFIQLKETTDFYEINFYLSSSYTIKKKKQAWLGRGKKINQNLLFKAEESFIFNYKIHQFNSWEEGIFSIAKKNIEKKKPETIKKTPEEVFIQSKNALWRSYDHKKGTFLQLPWRDTPGFTFVNSSYSLLSYEAVRLDYFSRWYEQTKDIDFFMWIKNLHKLFVNQNLYTYPKKGKGIIWYNMTTLTKKGLTGYFYMDTGYSGYPGGQATIDLHLLNYLKHHPNEKLEELVEKSLDYIMSTQQTDGSWPMAIKQEGVLKFRPEKLERFTSYGGTGEAIRALLSGSVYFDNEQMKNAAFKGLEFLTDTDPICYNGLRDIGIMEPEAFSAVSIINAYLDAYDLTNKSSYLQAAFTYAIYTLSWIYQWNTSHLSFYYNFHPISYSITPRLSPYETAWIITTFNRLSTYKKDSFWKSLNVGLFNHVISWISSTGGLSEGVFPNGFIEFKRLPMEQTFATVELMKSAETMMEKLPTKQKKKSASALPASFRLKRKKSIVTLYHKKEKVFSFDSSKAMITHIKNSKLNNTGITFSFNGIYTKQDFSRIIKQNIRGNYGKFILGATDIPYAITGVKAPNISKDIKQDLINNHIISSSIHIKSTSKVKCSITLAHHTIDLTFHFSVVKDSIHINLSIQVIVGKHDLPINQQILFPVIGEKPIKITKFRLDFSGFSIKGNCTPLIKNDSFTAIDQTLKTNWTHGGIYNGTFDILIQNNDNQNN